MLMIFKLAEFFFKKREIVFSTTEQNTDEQSGQNYFVKKESVTKKMSSFDSTKINESEFSAETNFEI